MSLLENFVLAAPPLAASNMHWEWVATNSQRILELTLSHLYQGVVPVAIGALAALPVAYYASRRRDRRSERSIGARTLMHLSSLLYTIPSIALFVLMPLILGTSIISPLNVLVALSVYSFSLMVRSGVDIPSEILAGVILSLLLALALDLLLILLTRVLTPWQAATVTNRSRSERKA